MGGTGHPNAPLRLNGGDEGPADRVKAGAQRSLERPARAERNGHYGDDTSRDDDVLERHHAVLVRAQTLHRFAGLDVILQHTIFLLLDVIAVATDIAATVIGKTCHQIGSNIFQIYSSHDSLDADFARASSL